jgi:uncharacterized membrane protein YgcG
LGIGEEAGAERIGARFLLRSSCEYDIQEAVTSMGVRRRKAYVLVTRRDTRDNLVMVASRLPAYAKGLVSDPCQREALSSLLVDGIRSRHVEAPVDVRFATGEGLVFTFHRLYTYGSLRDVIHGSSCRSQYHEKYSGKGKPLDVGEASSIGKQILAALQAIRDVGLPPHGHLHTGNVFIAAKGVAVVGEYANTLLCAAPRRHEDSIQALRADQGEPGDADVVCFGHLVHEMVHGAPPCRLAAYNISGLGSVNEREGGGGKGGGGKGGGGGGGGGDEERDWREQKSDAGERVPVTLDDVIAASLQRFGRPSVRQLIACPPFAKAADPVVKDLWLPDNTVLSKVQNHHVVLAGDIREGNRRTMQEEEVSLMPESVGAFGAALRLDLLRGQGRRSGGEHSSPHRSSRQEGMRVLMPSDAAHVDTTGRLNPSTVL